MNKAIQRLQAKLASSKAKAEELHAILSERDLTPEEDAEFNSALTEMRAINSQLDQACAAEAELTKAAGRPVSRPDVRSGDEDEEDTVQVKKLKPGQAYIRALRCLLNAKGNAALAADLAEQHYPEQKSLAKMFRGQALGVLPKFGQEKAATAAATMAAATWAGNLAYQEDLVSEFVSLLYPATIIGKMSGFREIPFNVTIPRMTGGVTGGWVGEGGWKPVNAGAFDRISLIHNKVAVIVVFTDEMLRFSDPSIDAVMQSNIIAAFTSLVDKTFIDYTGSSSASNPGPINGDGAGAVLQGVPSTGDTVAEITTDLSSALMNLANANIPMIAPYWVMSARTHQYLMTLRTTQDIFAFREELTAGKLLGIPVIASTNVPTNKGAGTDESFISLMDADSIFIARGGVNFDTSNQATLQMDSAPAGPATVSLWQTNMTGVRGEQDMDWKRARDTAFSTITGVTY